GGRRGRREALVGRPVAELAENAVAPAVGLVAGGRAAGVVGSRAHLAEEMPAAHRDGPRTISSCAVAEPAEEIVSPAEGPIIRRHAACVQVARATLAEAKRRTRRQ